MKATTAIGICLAVVMLLAATIVEGGNPVAFINLPAFLVVIGGTAGVTLASTDLASAKAAPKEAIRAMKGVEIHFAPTAARLVKLSETARRKGLLALESDIEELDDEFTRKGLQLVVDGTESDVVVGILQLEMESTESRHQRGIKLFQNAGGFAPTLGILGTVMSLVHVLENLASPAGLGHAIAGAFLATLYGVGSANVLFLPIANRLKEISAAELRFREMVLEGILSIQAGDNPRLLAERLETFVPLEERGTEATAEADDVSAPPAPSAIEPEAAAA